MLHLAGMTATSSSAGIACALQLAMHLDICGNFNYCSSFDQHVCFELCISVYNRASLEHNALRFSVVIIWHTYDQADGHACDRNRKLWVCVSFAKLCDTPAGKPLYCPCKALLLPWNDSYPSTAKLSA